MLSLTLSKTRRGYSVMGKGAWGEERFTKPAAYPRSMYFSLCKGKPHYWPCRIRRLFCDLRLTRRSRARLLRKAPYYRAASLRYQTRFQVHNCALFVISVKISVLFRSTSTLVKATKHPIKQRKRHNLNPKQFGVYASKDAILMLSSAITAYFHTEWDGYRSSRHGSWIWKRAPVSKRGFMSE